MIAALMKISDKVTVRANWDEGRYKDVRGEITGFSEIDYGWLIAGQMELKPGIYANELGVRLRLENGKEVTDHCNALTLADKAAYECRLEEFLKFQKSQPPKWHRHEMKFLRNLPDTPLWEGDFVYMRGYRGILRIVGVEYDCPNSYEHRNYTLSSSIFDNCWETGANDFDLVLVKRGPFWKFKHDDPLDFTDIWEEAHFFRSLGHIDKVDCLTNNRCGWTEGGVFQAIRDGAVDYFKKGPGMGLCTSFIYAYKFHDPKLGRRIAQAMLEKG